MAKLLAMLAPVFPFDPAVDTSRGRIHLMLIYGVVLLVQFGYAGVVVYRAKKVAAERKRSRT